MACVAPAATATVAPAATVAAATVTSPSSPSAGSNGYLAEAEKALQQYQLVRSVPPATTSSNPKLQAPPAPSVPAVNTSSPVIKSTVSADSAARRSGAFVVNAGSSSSTRVFPPVSLTPHTKPIVATGAAPISPLAATSSAAIVSPTVTRSPAATMSSPVPLIPPPAEFATEAVSAASTLRSVAKPQTNSMVFRAAVRTNPADVTTKVVAWPPKQYTDRKVETWSTEEVGEWLESLDLGIYRNAFTTRGVTGQMLVNARDQDFEGFGVSVPLHRIKLERELRKCVK